MKITNVETIVVNMPMVIEGPVLPQQGGRPRTSMDTLLVRVDTDGDVTGWGEGFGHRIFPATKAALDTLIGPMCVGRDPTAIAALMGELQRNLTGVGRNGPAMYALSAIDIALWDIAGKLAGLPLYRLLGGSSRNTLPAYASLLRYGEPGAVTYYIERALKRGYRHIKLHEITVGPIQAAREAAGPDIAIMVDCNCPWRVGEAIEMAHRFMPFNLKWLEEPVWPPEDYTGLARVRAALTTPIACGENEATVHAFQHIVSACAADVVQPSMTKVGGLGETKKIATLAAAAGVTLVPHSFYFGPGLAATVHLAASTPGVPYLEFPPGDLEAPLIAEPVRRVGALVAVSDRPGLGADPDPDVLRRYPYGAAGARPFYLT